MFSRRSFVKSASTLLATSAHGIAPRCGYAWKTPPSGHTPSAVATKSVAALKRGDLAALASVVHPRELARFKVFAARVARCAESNPDVQDLYSLFEPFDSEQAVTRAGGRELLAAMFRNSAASIPDFYTIIADVELEILGEIPEPSGIVHVVSRAGMPRPTPVSFRQLNGRWHQLLNIEMLRMITAFERMEHFRKRQIEEAAVSFDAQTDKIHVIGHVRDGDEAAYVLCRARVRVHDFTSSVLGCYPVRVGQPAWDLLDGHHENQLAEALRAKWEPWA